MTRRLHRLGGSRRLLAVVLLLGISISAAAGALARTARDDAGRQRIAVVAGRVVADLEAAVEAAANVGTAVAVASSSGIGAAEGTLPSQVVLDRAVRRLTTGQPIGTVAPGVTSVLVVAATANGTADRLIAVTPARAREATSIEDLAASGLQATLTSVAGLGSPALGPPLTAPVAGGDLAIVVPLYQSAAALQPTTPAATRRADLLGWVVVTLDGSTLSERSGLDAGASARVQIVDVSTPDAMPVGDGPPLDEPMLSRVIVMGVPGRTWQVRTTTEALLTAAERALPWLTVMVGLLLTIAATGLVALLGTQRSRALHDVQQATKELAITNAELQRSNTDLTQFASVAAHDLKSPLTVVRGFAPIIAKMLPEGANPKVHEMLEAIADRADDMAELIDDLLDYASVGAATMRWVDVDLFDLAKRVLDTMPAHREGPDRVTIRPLPTIRGDQRLLGQALANILGNALKFVPEGTEPKIIVSATQIGDEVLLRVEDNGVGIPEAERSAVLKAFQRSSRTTGFSGTGLGLAIVGRVAFAHGGTVELDDSSLGGAAVILRLPVAAPTA